MFSQNESKKAVIKKAVIKKKGSNDEVQQPKLTPADYKKIYAKQDAVEAVKKTLNDLSELEKKDAQIINNNLKELKTLSDEVEKSFELFILSNTASQAAMQKIQELLDPKRSEEERKEWIPYWQNRLEENLSKIRGAWLKFDFLCSQLNDFQKSLVVFSEKLLLVTLPKEDPDEKCKNSLNGCRKISVTYLTELTDLINKKNAFKKNADYLLASKLIETADKFIADNEENFKKYKKTVSSPLLQERTKLDKAKTHSFNAIVKGTNAFIKGTEMIKEGVSKITQSVTEIDQTDKTPIEIIRSDKPAPQINKLALEEAVTQRTRSASTSSSPRIKNLIGQFTQATPPVESQTQQSKIQHRNVSLEETEFEITILRNKRIGLKNLSLLSKPSISNQEIKKEASEKQTSVSENQATEKRSSPSSRRPTVT